METKTNNTPKNPHLVMRVALAESILLSTGKCKISDFPEERLFRRVEI